MMKMRQNKGAGFTLITAIFLLVVVASLSVYIISLRSVQQQTLVFGVQGARAMQAARLGIEWGIYHSKSGTCMATYPALSGIGPAISDFTVEVGCVESTHKEGDVSIKTYQLISTAETGVYGTLDFVSRQLQATVSAQPP